MYQQNKSFLNKNVRGNVMELKTSVSNNEIKGNTMKSKNVFNYNEWFEQFKLNAGSQAINLPETIEEPYELDIKRFKYLKISKKQVNYNHSSPVNETNIALVYLDGKLVKKYSSILYLSNDPITNEQQLLEDIDERRITDRIPLDMMNYEDLTDHGQYQIDEIALIESCEEALVDFN